MSHRAAGKSMQAALKEKGVSLHESTYRVQLKRALHNGCIGLDPQRSGGQALPSAIEKKIAEVVKRMREQPYPVFSDDVLKWAAEAIEGVDAASYFPDGKPTKGCYHGWLRRMEFLTGALRPLKLTTKELYTAENLATYLNVSKGVILKAGVAVVNPDYDPEVPYSQEILIIHPDRICSYDETKMELDCTKGGKGRKDRTLKAGPDDDGSMVVTEMVARFRCLCASLPATHMSPYGLPTTFERAFWTRTTTPSLGVT